MKLNSTFRKISAQFKIEFNEIASEINHNLTAGMAREKAIISLLIKYLPKRIGVDSGFVIDASGTESKQIDVVIYDKNNGVVFEVGGAKYFPCETVLAVGEVKSDISSRVKLEDALNKIKSVKELDRSNKGRNELITGPGISLKGIKYEPLSNHRDQIFGFIFTGNSMTKESIVQYILDYNKDNDRKNWMNLFCDIDKLLISYCHGEDSGEELILLEPSAMDATSIYCTQENEIPDLLLLFYSIIANFVQIAHIARPIVFDYAAIAGTDTQIYKIK